MGAAAYRFGGGRWWWNQPLRTDLGEEAVWQEVCRVLEPPERVEQAYRRRWLQTQTPPDLEPRERQVGRVRQGVARLIDSYTAGLIDQAEFEPRLTRLRERLGHLEAQAHQAREEARLEAELTRMLSRLEDGAGQVKAGLHAADWLTRRELIRALVKRVEVEQDQVRVVFRVGPHSPQPPSDTESPCVPPQSLHQCRRGD